MYFGSANPHFGDGRESVIIPCRDRVSPYSTWWTVMRGLPEGLEGCDDGDGDSAKVHPGLASLCISPSRQWS